MEDKELEQIRQQRMAQMESQYVSIINMHFLVVLIIFIYLFLIRFWCLFYKQIP